MSSADLDETGAFGDWPEDFGDLSLQLENPYLSAAEARLMQGNPDKVEEEKPIEWLRNGAKAESDRLLIN